MPLSNHQRDLIRERLRAIVKIDERVRDKKVDIQSGDVSPFMLALTGFELTLQTKVAQSLQTTMGMSFYEQVAAILGEVSGFKVELQKKVLGYMFDDVAKYIDDISERMGYQFNREAELAMIRTLTRANLKVRRPKSQEFKDSTVDVYVTTPEGAEFLIDVTTVKPNKKEFRVMKTKTLRWAAYRMSQDPSVNVEPYFALPYNPEASDILGTEYARFESEYDRKDILVGEEFWAKVSGGNCSITEIVDIFKEMGDEMGATIRSAISSR